ncbi:DNA-binding protein BIN4 [Canna indica]|uniref:DNA-binding protein BIN4 n=1 Tax=Canna indica TaxID=4628 RepID=A0AAQ3JVU8_9LILI|nr:DNA-binding protein BIN4 [Canna indica]
MSQSREASPDWLREFQPPSGTVVTLSSGSDSSPENSPKVSALDSQEEPRRHQKQESAKIGSGEGDPLIKAMKPKDEQTENDQILRQDVLDANEGPVEEGVPEKSAGPSVSSRLPLVFMDKVQRSKALVECDGDSIDLSGDVGAVGRLVISNGPTGNHGMLLDLKGTVYKTTIVPSRTFCVVSIGQSEAKIETIMNDFIQLEPQSNVFEAETMVEGTLDGFSFDSDEEVDRAPKTSAHQNDEKNENGDHTDTKTKEPVNKKAKTAARPAKKGIKKPQVSRRTKKLKK